MAEWMIAPPGTPVDGPGWSPPPPGTRLTWATPAGAALAARDAALTAVAAGAPAELAARIESETFTRSLCPQVTVKRDGVLLATGYGPGSWARATDA